MTLILTCVSQGYVVQTADCLVSIDQAGVIRDHDPNANKLIVFAARDAVATLGFSGTAYVGSTPTDEWLASVLWDGAPISRGPDGKRAALLRMGGPRPRWADVGTITQAILRSMTVMLGRQSALEVTIGGWQIDSHGLVRPFAVEIVKRRGQIGPHITRLPRHWYRHDFAAYFAVGAAFSSQDLQELLSPFHRRRTPASADEMVSAFRTATKRTRERTRSVGPDVLSVVLERPDLGGGRTRFHSDVALRFHARSGRLDAVVEVHQAPWILSQTTLNAPSLNIGDQVLELIPGYELTSFGAPENSGLLSLSSSLPRQPSQRR